MRRLPCLTDAPKWLIAAACCAWALAAGPAPARADDGPAVAMAGGPPAMVINWSRERCETWDAPDAPLRAFRNDRGEVIGLTSDSHDRPMVGPSLDKLKHVCWSNFTTKNNADPAAFSGLGYVVASWTQDGRTVYGLLHNEYHADRYPGRCVFKDDERCWYNAVVAVRSEDGGHRFVEDDPPVLVAAPAFRQEVGQGRHRGFFNPSNIVEHDGYLYSFINTTGGGNQKGGICLFRTRTIADPASWRAFDGSAFTVRAIDPYRADTSHAAPCQPIQGVTGNLATVVRHDPSGAFLGVFQTGPVPLLPTGGVIYAWSRDLLHWSPPHPLLGNPADGAVSYHYPAVLDPGSASRNFDRIGGEPWLYVVRFNLDHGRPGPNRDLVRFRLSIR